MKFPRAGRVLLAAGFFLGGPACVLAGNPPAAVSGSNVDETKVQKVYYADAASADAADDDKHGTADTPFATVAYACQTAARDKDRNVGAKVVIAPGTYRETVEIRPPPDGGPDTDAPLVIEAAEREQAVLDGADTEGWTPSTWKTADGCWTHPWPFRRNGPEQAALARTLHAAGAPPVVATGGIYRRGDLIFVNGTPLRQVNRPEDLAPGCFCERPPAAPARGRPAAAENPDTGAALVVQPPADTPLEGAIIQVGVRERSLVVHDRRNVVLRGLLVEHAAGPASIGRATAGILLDGCSNVLVEDVLSQWNDGAGLVVEGRADVTLRRVHLLHNGGSGLSVINVKNLLVEDGEASFNNFRGEWAGWFDATGPAGVKTAGVYGSVWRRLRCSNNFCRGVWWDGDNADAALEDAALLGNLVNGLLIENNPGPVSVRRGVVAGTKTLPGIREDVAWTAGISVAATPNVALAANVVASNAAAQLAWWDLPAAKAANRTEGHDYHRNVFYGADATQVLFSFPGGGTDYAGLTAGGNLFWNPARADVFLPRTNPMKGCLDLEAWRGFLAKQPGVRAAEDGSLWQDPLFADPAEGDFRLREQSPAADWNLPADEGSSAP